MKTIPVSPSLSFSQLAYGCWRIVGTWDPSEATAQTRATGRAAILAAYEAGYTAFDHADIYCDGEAERLFGEVLKEEPEMRRRITLVTKCGIRKPGEPKPDSPYRYDFSAGHIIRSCEESLGRLRVDSIDLYLLHRPDYLMNPAEVAEAFTRLKEAGKVREFGVSNFRPSQVTALQKACPMRLVVQQVEVSLAQLRCLEDGTLDQCLAEGMIPMAWSPLAGGKLGIGARKVLPSQEAYRTEAVLAEADRIASDRGVSRTAVALAWLLAHPTRMVPVIGSVDPANIREAVRATEIELSRDEWYRLLVAARGEWLP